MYFDIGYDMEQVLYNVMVVIGAVFVLIYNFAHVRLKKEFPSIVSQKIISRSKSQDSKLPIETITASVEIIIILVLYYFCAGTMNVLFGEMLNMSPNYYGTVYFAPLLLLLGCYIMGLDAVRVFDIIAPAYPLGLIFSKTGCFFAGCCSGMEWEHGLYNFGESAYQVPIQLIEALWVLLIFVILFSLRKKIKRGTGFPLYLILYSSIRFFSEFLRGEPDIFMNLKVYHFCCISGVIVGVVAYIIAIKYSEKISSFFTKGNFVTAFITDTYDKACVAYDKSKVKKQKKPIVHHKKRKK